MSNSLRIAVSGKSGCGNTTDSRMLAGKLGIQLINYTFHDMAREKGISFKQLCTLAEKDSQYDLYLDKKQVEMASRGSCVLGSRLAIWLLKDADLKVFLTAAPEVRAARISKREGVSFEKTLEDMKLRDYRDRRRYINLYKIDIDQFDFADLIVDTEKGDQDYVVDTIIRFLKEREKE